MTFSCLALMALIGMPLFQVGDPAPAKADRLTMAAQASGRPAECWPTTSGRKRTTIWDRAKEPYLQRYCDLLGKAHAQVEQSPAAARDAALLADKVLPGKAAPWILLGQANVLLENFPQALQDFEKARHIDAHSVQQPLALQALAIAQSKTGNPEQALATYRVLIPRLELVTDVNTRIVVLLHASSLAMQRGPSGLAEAVALLSEARSLPLSRHKPFILGMLALALDRSGQQLESETIVDSLSREGLLAPIVERSPVPLTFFASQAEWDALIALVSEKDNRSRAMSAWEDYLGSPPPPAFLEHAKKHLDLLRASPRQKR
jgi:tetratricopeptide (TPR) repeat protein